MINKIKTKLVKEKSVTKTQLEQIKKLQSICFSDVSDDEAEEDFYDPKVARVFAYKGDEIVSIAGIHLKTIQYKGKDIIFGGPAGFCVKEKYRRKGVGTMLCDKAMGYLKQNSCQIAFLSVALDNPARKMYKKFGFKDMPNGYRWTKSNGKMGSDTDGMLAPVNNEALFNEIMTSKKSFYVGNGYW